MLVLTQNESASTRARPISRSSAGLRFLLRAQRHGNALSEGAFPALNVEPYIVNWISSIVRLTGYVVGVHGLVA